MDTTKHTVTLPIADYEELIKNQRTGEESKAAAAHFDILMNRLRIKNVGEIYIDKVPIGFDMYESLGVPCVGFKY